MEAFGGIYVRAQTGETKVNGFRSIGYFPLNRQTF
jgi:hypothetical protein